MPSQGPTPLIMGIAIVVSLLVVAGLLTIQRRRRQADSHSTISQVMVGGPDIFQITSKNREDALRELASHASVMLRYPDEATILRGLLRREAQMPTGLEHGFAVPHARFSQMGRSLAIYAQSRYGIPWECVDDEPATSIFLLLTPEEDTDIQLKLLAEISRCVQDRDCRKALQAATDCRIVVKTMNDVLRG